MRNLFNRRKKNPSDHLGNRAGSQEERQATSREVLWMKSGRKGDTPDLKYGGSIMMVIVRARIL